MHDDEIVDDETTEEQDDNAHVLSIRRATGEEVVSIFSPNEEWSVYLQPGGTSTTNAFVGMPSEPVVWVNAIDKRIERDEDGTYFIRID